MNPAEPDSSNAYAFGHVWSSDVPLHGFVEAPAHAGADIAVRRVEALAERGAPVACSGDGSLYHDGLRLQLRDEVALDLFGGARIDWVPLAGWHGVFPPEMFGVAAATCLAMRGRLPLHGSAVEIEGRGVLICGPSGAGKSTIAAGLTRHGARLISDDLSVISLSPQGMPELHLGRPTIRLFPQVARSIVPGIADSPDRIDAKGKCAVQPERVEALRAVSLDLILSLEPHGRYEKSAMEGQLAETLLRLHYRPNWLRHIPGAQARLATIDAIARATRFAPIPIAPLRDTSSLEAICRTIYDLPKIAAAYLDTRKIETRP